ncbi:hypothetical protein D9M68_946190 [compost metagenome]
MTPALKPFLLVYKSIFYIGLVWLLNEPTTMRDGYSAVLVNAAVAQQFEKLFERRQCQWIPVDDFKPRLI